MENKEDCFHCTHYRVCKIFESLRSLMEEQIVCADGHLRKMTSTIAKLCREFKTDEIKNK